MRRAREFWRKAAVGNNRNFIALSKVRSALKLFARERRGVAAIEFSFVLPAMIVMVVCASDLGLGIYRNMQVQSAAQAGAQYAMWNTYSSTAISNAVTNATSYSGISASPAPAQYCGCADSTGLVTVTCGSSCATGRVYGKYVSVSSRATYTPILPYPLIASSFSLTGRADVRVQ